MKNILPVVEDGDEGERDDESHDRRSDHQVERGPGVLVPWHRAPGRLLDHLVRELALQVVDLQRIDVISHG